MAAESDPKTASGSYSSTVNGGATIEECQDMIRSSLRSPMVKFLREHMAKAGCSFGDNFIKAVNCDRNMSGSYIPGVGNGYLYWNHPTGDFENRMNICIRGVSIKIVVCSNEVRYQDHVDQVVIHELIHAYDDCRAANLDWSNCAHHACSEIRAGHLSGNCHYKRELLRGFMKIRGHEQQCVKRRAMNSVRANPNCSEAAAKNAMEAVWDTCYNDTKPFDRAP